MPRLPRERVQHLRAIDEVGRRQDQRGVRRPEHDPPPDQIAAPGRLGHAVGMGGEPFAHDRLRHRRGLDPLRHGRQIAQPGETVDVIDERSGARPGDRVGHRGLFAAEHEAPLHQRAPAARIAEQGIVGHRDQLQRIAPAQPHRVERGAPGQPVEPFGQTFGQRQPLVAAGADQALALEILAVLIGPVLKFERRLTGLIAIRPAHPPLSAAMLAAYARGRPGRRRCRRPARRRRPRYTGARCRDRSRHRPPGRSRGRSCRSCDGSRRSS